jgi:sec-independent protein translocase protein TatA
MHLVLAVITTPEIVIIAVVVLLLFGVERIPKLARSMGQAKKEFEKASQEQPSPIDAASARAPEQREADTNAASQT